ncbi:MAG: RagB/SusD family nutrient uptake outer membrane protein [Paludibacter sp.]|nr:RagB/SusD family nutrient uptake outer membrane protein [Paludibacter sp.]
MKINKWICIKWFSVLFVSALAFTSCESYLDIDKYVYDKMTIDSIFTNRTRILEYINGTAAYLPNESQLIGDWDYNPQSPSGLSTDEAIVPWADGNHPGAQLYVDAVTPQNTAGINPYANYYKGIRKANIILSRIGGNSDLTESDRQDYTGQAYFLRAYFYYSLVRLYGPVPLLPETAFETDATVDEVSYERNSWDECVEYICSDMEKAAKLLPTSRSIMYPFLPTKGAAYAVVARMRLYSASPLFNGGASTVEELSGWKRPDGTYFISQTNDPARWGIAAAAFRRIIDMGKYKLNTWPKIVNSKNTGTLPLPTTSGDANLTTKNFPDGAMDIDPYLSYKSLFDGSLRPESIDEFIYGSRRSGMDDRYYYPTKHSGKSIYAVTTDMIEQYRMADGRQYSDATAGEKSSDAVGSGAVFSEDYILNASRAIRDDKREPRFYASIGFNYCVWPATSYTGTDNSVKNFVCTYYKGGTSTGDQDHTNYTGYTSRKYVHQEDNILYGNAVKSKFYPTFRYAEVLLSYVEAMNEMTGTYTGTNINGESVIITRDPAEIVKYFNQIRYRAGLPGITVADATDRETMRNIIKQEWRVEFFNENHRYYDLRRWMDAKNAYTKPVMGLDVTQKEQDRALFYTPRVWNTLPSMKRTWKDKMYFFPFTQDTMDKNGRLVQNPGWK